MGKKINCILLIDDNPDDNFFHERVIRKNGFTDCIVIKQTGREALEYLKMKEGLDYIQPDLIFLDVNMPGMNGWEFLNEYTKLDESLQGKVVVIMLTTSDDPDDFRKAKKYKALVDYKIKPLTKEMLEDLTSKYF